MPRGQTRTKKSCYQSSYGAGWIPAQAVLAENACRRIAGANSLPHFFWRLPEWEPIFKRELAHANDLLATFSMKAISAAWDSPRGKYLSTLGGPHLRQVIKQEQISIEQAARRLEEASLPEPVNTLETPRPILKRHAKSIREKLAD